MSEERSGKILRVCQTCGEEAEKVYECPECERKGCDYCMPKGQGLPCPECDDEEDEQ